MHRFILLISVIPIIAALVARWWFVIRVCLTHGRRVCRCDLSRWLPAPGEEAAVRRDEASAAEFGKHLRLRALADWKTEDPKAAASRENTRRVGLILPPLSAAIAVLAVFAARMPVIATLAVPVGVTAMCALMGLLTLPAELAAIQKAARRLREQRWFRDSDDEEAVVRCAMADAWEHALPPILRLVSPPSGAR